MYNSRGVFFLIIKISEYKKYANSDHEQWLIIHKLSFNMNSNQLISYGDLVENDKGVIHLQNETKIQDQECSPLDGKVTHV